MKKTYLQKGFTLIELLVVIAIIGLLSSVVLAALSSARSRGSDASIKSSLISARTQASLYYTENGNSYDQNAAAANDVCNAAGLVNGVRGINGIVLEAARVSGGPASTVAVDQNAGASAGVGACHSLANGTGWAAEVMLKNGAPDFYCVDDKGTSRQSNASMLGAANDVTC